MTELKKQRVAALGKMYDALVSRAIDVLGGDPAYSAALSRAARGVDAERHLLLFTITDDRAESTARHKPIRDGLTVGDFQNEII